MGEMDDQTSSSRSRTTSTSSISMRSPRTRDESPVIKFVNLVIYQAIKEKVSDIHIEPFEKVVRVRFRSDGICYEAFKPPKALLNSIVSRIKIMCCLDIAERRKPQDGKFQIRSRAARSTSASRSCRPCTARRSSCASSTVATWRSRSTRSVSRRRRSRTSAKARSASSYGMMLVTGPTGSGKSTTLYSAVKEILNDELNFVTVEDPVEYQVHGVNQVQVSEKRGLTFAGALRSILRQDPDIVMIGEIRDTETIEIAIKAALTGHLVLSTLHTNDAASTITRMIDMGVDPFMVSSATLLVSAQRLARRLCKYCKAPLDKARRSGSCPIGFTEEEAETAELFKPVGCPRCKNGYSGRFALLETMPHERGHQADGHRGQVGPGAQERRHPGPRHDHPAPLRDSERHARQHLDRGGAPRDDARR